MAYLNNAWAIFWGLFTLGAVCCTLYYISDPLEDLGGRIGKLLNLPEDVIASTFQAVATSGPEIVMAVLSATPFVAGAMWGSLHLAEKACSGTLNMGFSAMDNLLGIGAVAILFMLHKGTVQKDGVIPYKPSTVIGLVFYIVISGAFTFFILDKTLTENESWILAGIAIFFIFCQLFMSKFIARFFDCEDDEEEDDDSPEVPSLLVNPFKWVVDLTKSGFAYAFLVFALIVFVREAMSASFDLATLEIASLGGVLILLTSYVSSFPEFMLAFRYVNANKKHELLGMLFGSNVIDLGFAGFRSMWLHESMQVYTTGRMPHLLPYYIGALPTVAILILLGLGLKRFRWGHAKPLVVFYVIYIVSGYFLL